MSGLDAIELNDETIKAYKLRIIKSVIGELSNVDIVEMVNDYFIKNGMNDCCIYHMKTITDLLDDEPYNNMTMEQLSYYINFKDAYYSLYDGLHSFNTLEDYEDILIMDIMEGMSLKQLINDYIMKNY